MRTLERNKIDFWVVNVLGRIENVDEDGYFTGEEIPVYSVPKKIRLSVYPVTEEIRNRVFGLDLNLDLVAIAGKDEVQLNEGSLLFLNEPKMSNISSDKIYYDYLSRSYDYSIQSIKESLNINRYGLRKKV